MPRNFQLKKTLNRLAHTGQGGFSMIEVLVTMLIISLALLGTVGLQTYALRTNQGGQFRSQAVFLVADMAERIEANSVAAVTSTAYVQSTSSTPDTILNATCSTGTCSPTDLAAYDLSQWKNAVFSTLPQSEWTVTRTVTGNPSVYTIKVSWVDREERVTYGATASKSASGTGDKMSYTATRTVFNQPQ